MQIRDATLADIDALIALQRRAPTASQWSARQYQKAIEQERTTLVVEKDSKIKGFLIAREVGGEWEIENVIVAPEVRRQGFGTRLLDEFINRVRDAKGVKVFLEVRESNVAARRLYELFGFVENSRRRSYYRSPDEDAISYVLNLT